MKKSLLVSIVVVIMASTLSVFSQGNNMQFNQVKHLTYSVSVNSGNTGWSDITTVTVPANKVWKIESSSLYDAGANASTDAISLMLDKQLIFKGSQTGGYSPTSFGPIWLGAGTYTLKRHIGLTGTFEAAISILEFNLIP